MARVLLAEDDPVSRRFLVEALGALGHEVVAVEDGDAAWRALEAQRFELLLLDHHLPHRSGADVMAALRAASRAARPAALALTADRSPALAATLRNAGFDAVACKPLTLDALAQALAGLGVGGGTLPTWDDAAAGTATGGDAAIVAALRGLLRDELPAQFQRIAAALQRGDSGAARGELHRLQAACGFCGARALAAGVDALQHALQRGATGAAEVEGLRRAVDALVGGES